MYIKFVNFVDQLNQYRQSKISNKNFLIIASVVVGVLAGLAAALLKGITHRIESFLQTDLQWEYKYYLYLLFPAIGILLSVLYVRKFIRKGTFETGLWILPITNNQGKYLGIISKTTIFKKYREMLSKQADYLS